MSDMAVLAPRMRAVLRITVVLLFLEHGTLKLFGVPLPASGVGPAMSSLSWTAHAPRSVFPVLNGGDAAILCCCVFLYFVAAGPGAWAVDFGPGREPEPAPRDIRVVSR